MRFTIQPLTHRILTRLVEAEAQEIDPWLRDDLRIARLIVGYAARGEAVLCSPDVLASYMVLGLHPEKVWPAILARRKAQGPLEVFGVPKKPPQSVKLWAEKSNGARAVNSRAGETILHEPPISVPMAAPSIAALYPNPDASSSAKTRGFTYDETLAIIEFSGAPHSIRQGTLSALKARGRWPNEDGSATGVICVSLIGMQLHGVCCRSTARWRARRAVKLGYWRQLRKANSWSNCAKCGAERATGKCEKCGYVGRAKTPEGKANFDEFCRPYMYEINIEKFRSAPRPREIRHFNARTYAEYKEAAKRGEHPNVTEMPSRKPAAPAPPPHPPAPAAPLPKREQPAAIVSAPEKSHRNPGRTEGCHTYRETKAFKDRIEYHVAGCSGSVKTADGSSIFVSAQSNPELFRAPMNRALAFKRALEEFTWTTDSAIRSMKSHGFNLEPPRPLESGEERGAESS
jgi:hypothetical protein